MNSNSLAAALRTWAASAPDSLFSRVPWIIACWQAHEGDLAVSGLLAATYGLDTDSDAPAAAPNQIQIPATWLASALKFDDRMFDLVTKRPAGRPGLLAMLERLTAAMGALPEAVDATQFTVANPHLDCSGGEWDLAAAAAILTAHGRTDRARTTGTMFWARIEADGTLTAPSGRIGDVIALAEHTSRTRLVTATDSPRPSADAAVEVHSFATLSEAAAWMAEPPRP